MNANGTVERAHRADRLAGLLISRRNGAMYCIPEAALEGFRVDARPTADAREQLDTQGYFSTDQGRASAGSAFSFLTGGISGAIAGSVGSASYDVAIWLLTRDEPDTARCSTAAGARAEARAGRARQGTRRTS